MLGPTVPSTLPPPRPPPSQRVLEVVARDVQEPLRGRTVDEEHLDGCGGEVGDRPDEGGDLGDDVHGLADAMNLGLLLFIPYRYLENAVLSRLREHGHDIPVNQARVFQRIDPEGARMSELAETAQLTKQTLTSIVDQLERAGYVRREADPADARARIVRIAPRGQEAIELAAPAVAEVEAEWERRLGKKRTRQLRSLLAELCEITDPFAT